MQLLPFHPDMSASIHYNAALALQARTNWFRNRKDIPLGTEAVKRDTAKKNQKKGGETLPQVGGGGFYFYVYGSGAEGWRLGVSSSFRFQQS